MEHVLLFAVVAFLLYQLMSGCGCNGFSIGGQDSNVCYMNCCGLSDYDCKFKKKADNAYQTCLLNTKLNTKVDDVESQLNDVESQLNDVLNYLSDFKYGDGIKCNLDPSN